VTALLPYAAAAPLNTDEMKSLAQWFFAVISWFQAHGMVHRDIKPANILVIRTQHGLEFKVGPSLQLWLDGLMRGLRVSLDCLWSIGGA
jgi:serine/threonine protein kinase